jgi:cytochrome c oxidase accessory protein FixG
MTQPVPIKIYPRLTSGRFNNIRVALVIITQLVFLGLPWLQWNQRQAVLFDLERHQFFVFGASFWPEDFVYLAAVLVVSALGLFWWTTLAGRLWCGYSCPQTVYTQIMLWIERLVLGDHKARRKLDAAPGSAGKLLRLSAAHGLMLLFSLWTGFSLVAYFAPAGELAANLWQGQAGPWEVFWILFYAAFTYLLAALLREKVCSHMCPYARFQGAMFDRDTLIISYDARRGEPRGKQADKSAGGCIDCGICVQVCPTGIDIRNGLQYECIGCAACIDACDQVMDQLHAPRGLIRYTSEAALEGKSNGKPAWQRPRVLFYSSLLLGIIGLSVFSFTQRLPFKADILRDRASLVRETDDGWLENSYSVRLINSSESAQRLAISVEGLPGIRLVAATPTVHLAATATETIGVRVQVAPQNAARGANDIRFVIRSLAQAGQVLQEKSSFIGE